MIIVRQWEEDALSRNKRFFWLKLKEDFFDEDAISWMLEQPKGKDYCIFYLKLCLMSLKKEGYLIRELNKTLCVPYDQGQLARLTMTDEDTVIVAMEILKKLELISISENGGIFLNQVPDMIGSETNKAEFMRKKRERDKLLAGNNVTQLLPKSYPEIEKETKKDKDTAASLPNGEAAEKDRKVDSPISAEKSIKNSDKQYVLMPEETKNLVETLKNSKK